MTYQLYEPFPGVCLWVDADESHMSKLMSEGRYEWRKVGYIQEHLKPGMTFVDAGAHVGYFTMLAASLVGEAGRVYAFEPDEHNLYWLNKSADANHYSQVFSWPMALGAQAAQRELSQGPSSGRHSFYAYLGIKRVVSQVPLDNTPCGPVDILKMDVEAAELDVLRGATGTLLRTRHLLMDLHPELGVEPEPIQALLHSAGFNLFDIRTDFAPLMTIPPTLVELLAVRR